MAKFTRSNPFHQEAVGAFKKPFGFWVLFLFVVIYAAVSMGIAGIANQFFHVSHTAFTVVTAYLGMQVGTYWLCRRFYKHTGRSMTREEYRWSFWRVFLSTAIFYFVLGGLSTLGWLAIQAQCHDPAVTQPLCNTPFAKGPIVFAIWVGTGVTLLINLCIVGFCLKTGLRDIVKLAARQANNNHPS